MGFSTETELSFVKKQYGVELLVGGDPYILTLCLQLGEDSLKGLSATYLATEVIYLAEFSADMDGTFDFSKLLLTDRVLQYCVQDSVLALGLEDLFAPRMAQEGMSGIYDLERQVLQPLVDMYLEGFPVDLDKVKTQIPFLEEQLLDLETRIFDTVPGYPRFPINSPQKKVAFVYDYLGLPCNKLTKASKGKGGGNRSADADALQSIAHMHPSVPLMIEWGGLFSVYTGMKKVHEKLSKDGRVHPKFRPIGYEATSRIYTVPSVNSFSWPLRDCIYPDLGHRFVNFDWSGAEFYLLAKQSGQQDIIDRYEAGEDIPTYIAAFMRGCSLEEAALKREDGKTGMYATIFGSEGASVSLALGVSPDEGEKVVERLWVKLDKMAQFRDEAIERALETGFTKTYLGRKRQLPNLRSASAGAVAKGKRQVLNTNVQSGLADLAKLAMIRIHRWLKNDPNLAGCKIRFHVFDSFLFQVPNSVPTQALIDGISDILRSPVPIVKFNFKVTESAESWFKAAGK